MKMRILPVMIGVAVLTLGVRVGNVWMGVATMAEAEDNPADAANVGPDDPFGDLEPASASAIDPPEQSRLQLAQTDAIDPAAKQGGGSGAGDGEIPANPLSMSDERIELLQQLSKRREELNQRKRSLQDKKNQLEAVEKRLDQKVARLKELRSEIEGLIVKYNKQQDKQVKRLVKIYEQMEAEAAARIFENLEMEVLLKVIDRMSERNTAPILAEMQPAKAQELTRRLADEKSLPEPSDKGNADG